MRIYFLIIILLFFVTSAMADLLKDAVIVGNKRTTREALLQHAQIKIAKDLNSKDIQSIIENLRRINQIILLNHEFKDGVLTLVIEEKWTLFPVPMITQSGSYYNRGFLIYEDNFLGSLGTFAPGISWSNNYLNALLYYQDESLWSPQLGIKLLLLRKSDYVQFKRNNQIIDTHEARYDSVLVTPNFIWKNQVFKAGPLYTNKQIVDQNGKTQGRDQSWGLFFRHHLNSYQVMNVMYDGLVTTYDVYAIRGAGSRWYIRQEADAKWSFPFNDHFLNIGLHAHLVNDDSYLYSKIIGGDEGYRGYDKSSVPAKNNFGFLGQYQYNLFNSIYLSPFYEFNHTKLIQNLLGGATLNEHTIGIGFRYYFKKISIPAVIFDIGRNIDDRSTHYLLNIGATI